MNARIDTAELGASRREAARGARPLERLWLRACTYRPSTREAALFLVLAVVAVFGHAMYNDFVQWDDPINLVNNTSYRGLGWTQIQWMLTSTLMGHYIPVTWLTFGLDYVLWGMEPSGYHFTNVVLHCANVLLFFTLALRLLPRAVPWATTMEIRLGAVVSALVFAIHPLRAESVAWATERRDVLSGLMLLACVLCYLSSIEQEGWKRRRRLLASLVLFELALLSKSITMTLPFALLILDVYPLRRLPASPREWLRMPARRVLLEKIPFFVVGGAGAGIAYWAVAHNAFFTSSTQLPLLSRIALALYSVCFYIAKTVMPLNLSPLYELPAKVRLLDGPFALAAVATLLMTLSLLGLARRWPAVSAAYLYYVIAIAPVGGLVHAGFQLAHDRYSYVSCMGFALLAGGIPAFLGRARVHGKLTPTVRRLAAATVIVWIAALGVLTSEQVRVWRNTESLWLHAALVEPECSICHHNMGALLVNQGNAKAALVHFNYVTVVRPDRETIHGGIGLAMLQLDRPAEAEVHLKRALKKDGADVALLNNVGMALIRQSKFEDAMPFLRRALVLEPTNLTALANLGAALAGTGHLDAALQQFHRAAELDPYAAEPRLGLVRAYLEKGNTVEAGKHYTILRQLHPKSAAQFARQFAT
ncbi:MAG TPA: tetratricopeptide repeat protein [Gemmatimonadaceae bacterium]